MSTKLQDKEYSIEIYSELNDSLLKKWQNLYLSIGGNYNLSPDWCKCWFKHFGLDKEPYIIAFVVNDNLKLLAPFYINKDTLSLIGTNPDLIDEFSILYKDTGHIDELIDYIFDKKINLDFKYININSNFAKSFFRRLEQNQLLTKKIDSFFVKPYVNPELNLKESIKYCVKRRKNSAKNKYDEDLAFEIDTGKNQDYFDEFVSFHNERWKGEIIDNKNLNEFFRDLFLNTDITVLSRLSFLKNNTSLSYILGIKGANEGLYTVLTSFNSNFMELSPGIVIFHDLISEFKSHKFKFIDLGRGGLDYKYKFTNDYQLLLNVRANVSWKKYRLIYSLLKQAKKYFIGIASKFYI